jgi:hypothetical protein
MQIKIYTIIRKCENNPELIRNQENRNKKRVISFFFNKWFQMKYIAKYCIRKEFRHVKIDILLIILSNYLEVVSCEFESPTQGEM